MSSTGSILNIEIVSKKFEWTIENFSLGEDQYLSPACESQNVTWSFVVFPKTSDGYIHLGLRKFNSNFPITVEFSVALETSDGEKSFERGGTEIFDEGKYDCRYRWISRSEFERRETEFLVSGCLTVLITPEIVDFVECAGRRLFFRSKYIPRNRNNFAPISHERLNMSTTSDEVQNENVSEEYEWKIDNFSLMELYYSSPEFEFQREIWEFKMIPKLTDGYIGLDVWRKSSASPILVELCFALKTSDGQKRCVRAGTDIFDEWKISCAYLWMKRSEFERQQAEFLSSGCLKIIITLKIVDAGEPASESGTVCQPKNKIHQDLKQMFLSQENCDVLLRVKGQEFSAHKNILMARSPVFASTFRNDMKEKESGVVNIEDIDPSSFPDFLCFVYCGEIDNLSEENVFNIFTAADKYDISDLRTMCLNFMAENLSVDTFCETLVLALLHNENDLSKTCTNFFVQNAEEITASVKWQSFAVENPTQSNELFIKYIKSIKHSNK